VTFEGYMPRPGRYRAWTQFLRNGELTTFSFTFRVVTLDEAVRLERVARSTGPRREESPRGAARAGAE
jgi:hypothetical protein